MTKMVKNLDHLQDGKRLKQKENLITKEGGRGMVEDNKEKKVSKKKSIYINEGRDELGRIIINESSQIPQNMTEDETVKFWETHAMSEELLDASYIEDEDDLPPPRKQSSTTKPINVRIENDLLKRLQRIAEIKEIPYQTLLKQFVTERLYEEEKREKIF
jgi:predicted DNA binding CopG/RHH family protein